MHDFDMGGPLLHSLNLDKGEGRCFGCVFCFVCACLGDPRDAPGVVDRQ